MTFAPALAGLFSRFRLLRVASWASWGALILIVAGRGGKWPVAAHGAQALALFSGLAFLSSRPLPPVSRHPAFIGLLGLLVWQALSGLAFPAPWAAWRTAAGMWSVAALAVVGLFSWDDRQKRWVEYFLAGVVSVQSCLFLAAWELGRPPLLLFPGNAQYASFWSVAVFFLSLGRVIEKPAMDRFHFAWAVVSGLALAGVLGLPVRSGLLSLVVGLPILGWARFRSRGLLSAAAFLVLALAAVPTASIEQRLKLGDPLSFKRPVLWKTAFAGIMERPFLGWGPGNFENLYWRHAAPQEGEPVRFELTTAFAHNDYLQLAAESGLPALFFLLAIAGGLLVSCSSGSRGEEIRGEGPRGEGPRGGCPRGEGPRGGCPPGLWAAGGALAVFAAVNFPLALPADGFLIACLVALSGAARETRFFLGRGARLLAMLGAGGLFVLAFGEAALAVNGSLGPRRILALDAMDPRVLESRIERADTQLHSGDPNGERAAERELRGLLRWNPQNARVWRDWAHLEREHRSPPRLESAGKAYQRALELRPFHAPWRLEWASLLAQQGDLDAARRHAREALQAEPRYFQAALAQATIVRLQGAPERALRLLRALRRESAGWPTAGARDSGYRREILNRDPAALDRLEALCLMDLRRYEEARGVVRRLDWGDPERASLDAGCLFFLGRRREAERTLQTARKRFPDDPRWAGLLERVRGENP